MTTREPGADTLEPEGERLIEEKAQGIADSLAGAVIPDSEVALGEVVLPMLPHLRALLRADRERQRLERAAEDMEYEEAINIIVREREAGEKLAEALRMALLKLEEYHRDRFVNRPFTISPEREGYLGIRRRELLDVIAQVESALGSKR